MNPAHTEANVWKCPMSPQRPNDTEDNRPYNDDSNNIYVQGSLLHNEIIIAYDTNKKLPRMEAFCQSSQILAGKSLSARVPSVHLPV